MQQRSLNPILMSHPETPKRTKHVQISGEDTVFAFPADQADASTPGGMRAGAQLQLLPEQQQEQRGMLSGSQGTKALGGLLGPQSTQAGDLAPEMGEASTQQAADAAAAAGPAAAGCADVSSSAVLSRGNSGSRRPLEANASTRSRRLDSSTQQGTAGSSDGSSSQSALKKRGSRSSKLAVQLPQMLLMDADDACAAEAATPHPGGDSEHRQVCFTPQAPEQGGKRNAILMRQLNKGRSLKHLEDMMLAVAGGEMSGE
jgi:hypothetical protein